MNPLRHSQALRLAFSAALVAVTLTACGGGSGGDPSPVVPEPTPTPTPAPTAGTTALQGLWQSAAGAAASTSAITLPDGKIWAVLTSAGTTRLVKADLTAQTAGFAGSGKSYTLGTSTVDSLSATASVLEKTSLSGTLSAGGQSEAFALSYQTRYDTPAALADYAGNWQATLGPGSVSWQLSASGRLSGTRTTGCTYAGQVSLRAEQKAVVDVVVNETCSGTLTALQGVAVLTADKARVTMLLTTADERQGVAVNLARP